MKLVLIEQMPRKSLVCLLVAQFFVLAPHFYHLPLWLLPSWLIVIVWRLQMYRGVWRAPSRVEKTLLAGLCCAGLLFGYSQLFALEPMLGLLVVAFILKLLEMHRRQDLLLVIFVGFFVVAAQLLFSSSIPATLYALLSVYLLLVALIAANQTLVDKNVLRGGRQVAVILSQSVPLMLVVFLFVPRLGALWSVPSFKNVAKTGVSDSMSPGDFSQLGQSNEVAFRVTFTGSVPEQDQLYWRGLVFSQFDGRRWSQSQSQIDGDEQVNAESIKFLDQASHYEVMFEPSQQPWLYALPAVKTWTGAMELASDFTLKSSLPVTERMRYQVTSHLNYRQQSAVLSDGLRRLNTRLPQEVNPDTRRLISQWFREEDSDRALIARLLQHYRNRFTYTLQPPLLGRHSVDEFLWQSQRGFCEHFASSFVFAMRVAGIPARVVAGYQGGEFNPVDNYLIVRQKNAHAWAEVWLDGHGWLRVDPTAAVAPERVEQSLEASLSPVDTILVGGLLSGRNSFVWLNRLQLQWDATNYRWQRWVMSFDSEQQSQVLARWLGGLEPWRLALAFLGACTLLLLPIWLRLRFLRRVPPLHPAIQQIRRFEKKLIKLGFARLPAETIAEFCRRLGDSKPEWKSDVLSIAELYQRVVYAEEGDVVTELKHRIRLFRP